MELKLNLEKVDKRPNADYFAVKAWDIISNHNDYNIRKSLSNRIWKLRFQTRDSIYLEL